MNGLVGDILVTLASIICMVVIFLWILVPQAKELLT